MAARRDERGGLVFFGGFALLFIVSVGYGWIGRRVLRSLIDSRQDAQVLGVTMVVVPAALLATAISVARSDEWRAGKRVAVGLVLAAVMILFLGLLGGTGGKSPSRDVEAELARELHGFRDYFLLALTALVATAGAGAAAVRLFRRVRRRRRRRKTAHPAP